MWLLLSIQFNVCMYVISYNVYYVKSDTPNNNFINTILSIVPLIEVNFEIVVIF